MNVCKKGSVQIVLSYSRPTSFLSWDKTLLLIPQKLEKYFFQLYFIGLWFGYNSSQIFRFVTKYNQGRADDGLASH